MYIFLSKKNLKVNLIYLLNIKIEIFKYDPMKYATVEIKQKINKKYIYNKNKDVLNK